MLKIAICDDEKVFRDNINKYVAAYLNEKEISYEIDTFSSGKEIIDLGIEIKNSIFRNSLIFQGLPPIKYQNLMYFPLFLPL
ncbi:MAG: hypothetical protein ACLTLY_10790 [Agathobacter rectalis]